MANHEDKFKYVRERNHDPFPVKYSLRRQERPALVVEAGVHGLVLFEYYLRLASMEDVELTDQGAADYFGWNLHTVRRHRRVLINKGWLNIEKATLSNGNRVVVYYLGKAAKRGREKSTL